MDWKAVTSTIVVHDTGPRGFKQYRTRGGRMAWRNYRRDVSGGISLIQRLKLAEHTAADRVRQLLSEMIFHAPL